MNILSLFDGISCARIALDKAKVPYDKYYSSEIDNYALGVAYKNYPDTEMLGDINYWDEWDLHDVDLIIGGSPCQGFSLAGKRLNFNDPRSRLFFDFIDILDYYNPKYFLLENVKMKDEWKDIITQFIGVKPVLINSSLVSAQNRQRLYWTNIPIGKIEDRKITWKDIKETNVADNFYYSERGLAWIDRYSKKTGKKLRIFKDDEKCQMIEASHYKNYSAQRFFAIEDVKGLRYITPLECERAQTIPDNYTEVVSNTQRYKMIGNAFTVNVIAEILKGIK